jgi:uncharacterized membrane protein (UPF0127 family)
MIQAINRTRRTTLCARLDDAGGLSGQTKGLLGRDGIDADQGLLFIRNRFEPFMWMHMFFMRYRLKPWRTSPILFRARKALELAAGAAVRSATMVGDEISFADAS